MADISRVKLSNGEVCNFKDLELRQQLKELLGDDFEKELEKEKKEKDN